MLEDKFRENDTFEPKILFVAADTTLKVNQQVVRADADGVSGAFTITLPPVVDAKGQSFFILAVDADGVNTVTVEDNKDDSECWEGDVVLGAPCEGVVLESDGRKWWRMGQTPLAGVTTALVTTGIA